MNKKANCFYAALKLTAVFVFYYESPQFVRLFDHTFHTGPAKDATPSPVTAAS